MMNYIDDDFVTRHTVFSDLIDALKHEFRSNRIIVPSRHHHNFPSCDVAAQNALLVMPAFDPGHDTGVKLLNINSQNAAKGLPSMHGVYVYSDAETGRINAIFDAKKLTAQRTAATSALASSYLARKDADTLLMIGTGALAIPLILAHRTVRPIKRVFVWGRSFEKAQDVVQQTQRLSMKAMAVSSIDEAIGHADIISCATRSKEPLIFGNQLKHGQHLDLVGAYQNDMRESDDETMMRCSIFVDTLTDGLYDNGDIVQPMKSGAIKIADIKGDLFSLCLDDKFVRINNEEITLFKSVGFALEDLVAARYYFNQWKHEKNI